MGDDAVALLVVVSFISALNCWMRTIASTLQLAIAIWLVNFGEHFVSDLLAGCMYVILVYWFATSLEHRKISVARDAKIV